MPSAKPEFALKLLAQDSRRAAWAASSQVGFMGSSWSVHINRAESSVLESALLTRRRCAITARRCSSCNAFFVASQSSGHPASLQPTSTLTISASLVSTLNSLKSYSVFAASSTPNWLPMYSPMLSLRNVLSPHSMTWLLFVFFITILNCWSNVSFVASSTSASSIQFTLKRSPRQDPMCLPFTVSASWVMPGQYVPHELSVGFEAETPKMPGVVRSVNMEPLSHASR
mmetsp:Transcript_47557/g.110846  ORF Transcript_47557/g.110846 Transcript_47557/m.110846 type:complete len:228 (+) Transcript_47557:447-1130(+)